MKWMVQGNLCLGTFDKCNIKIGEELTLDFQWDVSVSRNSAERLCASHDCRRCSEARSIELTSWKTLLPGNPNINNIRSEADIQKNLN